MLLFYVFIFLNARGREYSRALLRRETPRCFVRYCPDCLARSLAH